MTGKESTGKHGIEPELVVRPLLVVAMPTSSIPSLFPIRELLREYGRVGCPPAVGGRIEVELFKLFLLGVMPGLTPR